MNERAIKRLLVIFVISLVAIFMVKKIISRTVINMNRIVAEKKQFAARSRTLQQMPQITSDAAVILDTPSVSKAEEAVPLEPPPVSGVGVSE